MMTHPDLMLTMAHNRERELIAEADQRRLFAVARKARKARKAREARRRPAGTLAPCEPSAVVPAR